MRTVKPKKLRILSVGIADYSNSGRESLPCAVADAKAICDLFSISLPEIIVDGKSWALGDVNRTQFIELLSLISRDADPADELLVVYFSGHAEISEDVFNLVFNESNRYNATVSSIEIAEIIRKSGRPWVLFLLDCCYSGGASDVVLNASRSYPHRTFLVTSSSAFEPSMPGKSLSVFTESFIQSFRRAGETKDPLRLDTVVEAVKNLLSDKSQTVEVYKSPGLGDIVFRDSVELIPGDRVFSLQFARCLMRSPAQIREVMYYSLAEFPESITLDTLECIAEKYPSGEALWKVRRAMGSSLSRISHLQEERNAFCINILATKLLSWETVGIIGLRDSLGSRVVDDAFAKIIMDSESPDTQWLSFLYQADHKGAAALDAFDISRTMLSKTRWGIAELTERSARLSDDCQDLAHAIDRISPSISEAQMRELLEYLSMMRPSQYSDLFGKPPAVVDPLVAEFSQQRQRGSGCPHGFPKWLYSTLYGSWRGHFITSEGGLLSRISRPDRDRLVSLVKSVPAVAVRMALFEELGHYGDMRSLELGAWGFMDPHPWVRRAALEWMGKWCDKVDENQLSSALDQALSDIDQFLPGKLDLLFEIARLLNSNRTDELLARFVSMLESVPVYQRDALNRALSSENIVFR